MRVAQLGEGDPSIAIVGAIHGDEPCGVKAVERLLANPLPVERPVKLIVANEKALARNVRYVDADLNRAFGEEVPADAHERGLARRLAAEIRGDTALAIHSTQSTDQPFAITSGISDLVREVVPRLSVTALVDIESRIEGRIFATEASILEIEAGRQGTQAAAENAYDLIREFLITTGALSGDIPPHEVPIYRLGEAIPKPRASEYYVYAENFERVAPGERFAAADGRDLVADEAFWPVLLSPYGYADVFGYRSALSGRLTA
jgi:predicted deacylase